MMRNGVTLWTCFFLFIHIVAQIQGQSNSRSYDTSDWIPVSRPCPTCYQDNEEKQRPTGRVLNLPAADQKQFFPTESAEKREEQESNPQPQQTQKQQILLPPQLQSIISQGQHYLSPHRINTQLLQEHEIPPSAPVYQQPVPTISVQNFVQSNPEINSRPEPSYSPKPVSNGQEEVQLLYVPLENLRQRGQRQHVAFPTEEPNPPQSPLYPQPEPQPESYQTPAQHKQIQLQNIQQEFVQQALQAQKLQQQFQQNNQATAVPQQNYRRPEPLISTTSSSLPPATSVPKKRKPHQPPLAVYMGTEGHQDVKVGDVLALLKDAKTISVQDNITPNSPQVFVGPSHLEPPEGYTKFELPYLSNIDGNRIERKVEQLPFFVAPLSYKTPPGYSKIPFPAPHVGSVIVNHLKAIPPKEEVTEKLLKQYVPEEDPSTIRTRTRHRQQSVHASPTTPGPVLQELPFGPLSPIQKAPESNPYGPAQFIQSTTPVVFNDKPVPLPEEIFSTRNRFPTIAPIYKPQNPQFLQNTQSTTNSVLESSTESKIVQNEEDKYTVLEQFEITPRTTTTGKYQSAETERVPHRNNVRVQYSSENYYEEVPADKAPLQQLQQQQIPVEQPLVPNPPARLYAEQQVFNQKINPQYETQQPIRQNHKQEEQLQQQAVKVQTPRSRGKSQFTPDYYFQEEYESQAKTTEQQRPVYKEVTEAYLVPASSTPQSINSAIDPYYGQEQSAEYILPAKLPAISPQLPGLVNSLEDQALRPLLAPLLIPASEEVPITELTSEYYAQPSTSTTTTTTTTSVPDTTTPHLKRTRGRTRVTRPTQSSNDYNTTPTSRRTSSYRGRRPYSSRSRQETTKQTEDSIQSSTIHYEESEITTKSNYNRNRVPVQREQSSRTSTANRQRFRTRGRPIKNEEEFSENFSQPPLEGGFKASVPVYQQKVQESYVNIPEDKQILIQKPQQQQQEQALVYVQNLTPQVDYVPREQNYVSSTESVAVSIPENNIVPNIKSSTPVHVKYVNLEPTTTEYTRNRIRSRGRQRARVHSTPVTTTTRKTTTITTEIKPDEGESEEYYGFIRQPQFEKPVQVNYKPNPVQEPQRSIPTVAYVPQLADQQRNVYVSSTPNSYLQGISLEDSQADTNIQPQYIANTPPPPPAPAPAPVEDTVDVKPVARRPVSGTSRGRRPTGPDITQTTKRPASRVRGRVRKPRPTTTTTTLPIESENSYTSNEYSQSPRTNELPTANSDDYIASTPTTRQRVSNRGKFHYKLPANEKTNHEPESDNYPTSFLKGQAPKKLIVQEVFTQKPQFQLTIEPEEIPNEPYADASVSKQKVATRDLDEGAESQYSSKFVAKPPNFNYIVSDEKNVTTETETEIETKQAEKLQLTTIAPETTEIPLTTTEIITTEDTDLPPQTEKPKSRRRGVWRLVRLRPVMEEFETAESQNIGSFLNEVSNLDKPQVPYEKEPEVETTTVLIPETTVMQESEQDFLAPLYEMFGFTHEGHSEVSSNSKINEEQESVETTTDNNWHSRIIGTSTTTEVSHETEICYRGRCIKSQTTDNDSVE